MPPSPWKTLTSREVYRNNWIRVREDVAELPNGRTTIYGVCELGRAVGVLPFLDDDHVVMVRQYRYIQKENERWEIPTGGARRDESLEEAARREMMEEAGYRPGRLDLISTYYTSKSVCDETAYLFIGRELSPVGMPADETEFLEVAVLPFDEVLEMVLRSEIRDSMSVTAILLADRMRV
jgi:ADP-ribose pyrophosphatase